MQNDSILRKAIEEQLNWEPLLQSTAITVTVKHGMVTLTGQVDTNLRKILVERAVQKVSGVKGISENTGIVISSSYRKSDA